MWASTIIYSYINYSHHLIIIFHHLIDTNISPSLNKLNFNYKFIYIYVISRSSASELYQSKVRQRTMFMRLTTVRNGLWCGASRTRVNHQCRGKHVWDEGHFSIFMQRVFKHVGTKNLHYFMLFLTLEHKRRILSSFSLEIAPSFPLEAIKLSMHAIIIKHESWCLSKQESNKSRLVN